MKKVLCFIISLFILANIVCAQTTITEVTLNLPLPPEVDADIVNDFSVPDNLAYEANNNGKMTIKMIGNSGEITSGKYLAAEEYTWSAIVCPKEGYSFPSKTSDLNFTINGFDINDNTIVASTEKTINNTTCRGLTIYFKALPGVRKRFLTGPEYNNRIIVGNEANFSFSFSVDATIKLQKQETYNWIDIASYNVLAEEVYNFSVPTESSIKTITYRLLYEEDGNNKTKEFKIEWYNPNTIVYGFEVTLPEKPVVDANIIYDYTIPENDEYAKSDWNEGKLTITGDTASGKYSIGSYSWTAIVCPKEGYGFVGDLNSLNVVVNGIDLEDEEVVAFFTKGTYSMGRCRGVEIVFKDLYDIEIPDITIKSDNNKVTLNWEEQKAATRYLIYRSEDGKKYKKYKEVTTNEFVDSSLTYGKTYYYKVKSCDTIKCSEYSDVVSKKIKPNKVVLDIKSAGTNNVKLEWERVKVSGYQISRSTDNKNWTTIKTITDSKTLEYNNKSLKANKTYYYKVRAYKSVSGTKVYGSWSNVVSTKTAPNKPSFEVKLKNYTSMKLEVGYSKGTSEYKIYRSLDNKNWLLLNVLNDEGTYTDGEHEGGKTYYYKVKACNSLGRCSGYVYKDLKQTVKTPKLTLESTKAKKVKITLSSVDGAVGYKVYRATSRYGKYELINEITDLENLSFTNKTKSGYTYYYKTRAYSRVNGSKVFGPYSGVKAIRSK